MPEIRLKQSQSRFLFVKSAFCRKVGVTQYDPMCQSSVMHNDKIVFFSSGVGGKGIDILRPASN